MAESAYTELRGQFQEIMRLRSIAAMLQWDAATQMPTGSGELRGSQLALIEQLNHRAMASARLADLLNAAEADAATLPAWDRANLAEMRRQWVHANAVEERLVAEMATHGTLSELAWRDARQKDDFKAYQPYLETTVALARQVAARKAEALGCSPYEALMDSYDPGRTTAQVDGWFATLKQALPGILERALARQEGEGAPPPVIACDAAHQKLLVEKIVTLLGFDRSRGRVDESTHPFCGGFPGDIRLTTRYDTENLLSGLMSTCHEAGHALYESHLPADTVFDPAGQATSYALHESQSLFVEMQLCRSRSFIRWLAAQVNMLPGRSVDADALYRSCIRVEKSFIRVDADEVTYPFHIMLRYDLEKALIAGDLAVADLPGAWREGMERYLGITPPDDRRGVLQDIHWSDGSFGYFPSYTIGAMMAAQFKAAMEQAVPEWRARVEEGAPGEVLEWLRHHIHRHASSLSADRIVQQATGKALSPDDYLNHLTYRYVDALY